jgi:hypothetical protein
MAERIILTIIFGLVTPVLMIGFVLLVFSSRITDRMRNVVLGVWIVWSMPKGPDFLGFYRPADLRHILYDISILCGYLVCACAILPWPKRKQTKPELAATYK